MQEIFICVYDKGWMNKRDEGLTGDRMQQESML